MRWLKVVKEEIAYFGDVLKLSRHFKGLIAVCAFVSLILSLSSGAGVGLLIPFIQAVQGDRSAFVSYLQRFGISFSTKEHELIFLLLLIVAVVLVQNLSRFY